MDGVERLSGETGQSGEDAFLRLALKVSDVADRAVVLAGKVFENDAGPFSRSKLRLANKLDHAELISIDKDTRWPIIKLSVSVVKLYLLLKLKLSMLRPFFSAKLFQKLQCTKGRPFSVECLPVLSVCL